MVVNLSQKHSLVSNWMSELRDVELQGDRPRFRHNLQRIGEVAAYEISKELPNKAAKVQTPLGTHTGKVLQEQPVLAAIMRTGVPLHHGMLNYFDKADTLFIGSTRVNHRDGTTDVNIDYLSNTSIENRVIIITDAMIATGTTIIKTLDALRSLGTPADTYIVCAIASTTGIEYIRREAGIRVKIWCGDVDDEITAKGFIVPGLGDAGDLALGIKSTD
ncbi:MAG TPA: uracil phosphoribosyltransferase [Chitinophagaceae bacterium]|nr:uracil phosphoribosyltransferase [Chitinophagaceae bacterium]